MLLNPDLNPAARALLTTQMQTLQANLLQMQMMAMMNGMGMGVGLPLMGGQSNVGGSQNGIGMNGAIDNTMAIRGRPGFRGGFRGRGMATGQGFQRAPLGPAVQGGLGVGMVNRLNVPGKRGAEVEMGGEVKQPRTGV